MSQGERPSRNGEEWGENEREGMWGKEGEREVTWEKEVYV
jgi:hypothetical protein